jgi:hypothetical protein
MTILRRLLQEVPVRQVGLAAVSQGAESAAQTGSWPNRVSTGKHVSRTCSSHQQVTTWSRRSLSLMCHTSATVPRTAPSPWNC